jgi:hypothetical protein
LQGPLLRRIFRFHAAKHVVEDWLAVQSELGPNILLTEILTLSD